MGLDKIDRPRPRREYPEHIERLAEECAFCQGPEDGLDIREYPHWIWKFAAFPYRKYHTLVVPKRHVLDFSLLSPDEVLEFQTALKNAESAYRSSGVVSDASEFGDQLLISWRIRLESEQRGKQPVAHFHAHLYPRFKNASDIEVDPNASDFDIRRLKA